MTFVAVMPVVRSVALRGAVLCGAVLLGAAVHAVAQPVGAAADRSASPRSPLPGARFEAVDLFIDAGPRPLAAYQLEFRADTPAVKIAGVEGGEHPAFAPAPYYDPAAIQHERVIIGALSTLAGPELPAGRTRVARVHVMVEAGASPRYQVTLQAAAGPDAVKFDAEASLAISRAPAEADDEGAGS